MDKQTAKKDLLWAAYEDWTGLWEAVWHVQTQAPELRGEPAQRLAHEVLKELLKEGLIYLCTLEGDNVETRLSDTDAYELMDDPSNWETPDLTPAEYRFATTDAGERKALPGKARTEASS